MTPQERLASEARRLLSEPLLVEALDDLMGDAFAEFKALKISPETLHEIIALQQRVNVIQEIPDRIREKIYASGQNDGGMAVEKKPTE